MNGGLLQDVTPKTLDGATTMEDLGQVCIIEIYSEIADDCLGDRKSVRLNFKR